MCVDRERHLDPLVPEAFLDDVRRYASQQQERRARVTHPAGAIMTPQYLLCRLQELSDFVIDEIGVKRSRPGTCEVAP